MQKRSPGRGRAKQSRLGSIRLGTGPTLLLLPALSSISTRKEMRPLQMHLASTYETISVDWPGFGDRAKPEVDWRPEAYVAFLDHLVTHIVHLQPVQQDMRQTMCLLKPLLSQVRWVGCA